MKKSMLLVLLVLVTAGVAGLAAAAEDDLRSLRGMQPLEQDSKEPAFLKWQSDREPIQRDYIQQPPLVPHSIDGYTINTKFNKCLTCHSWANYREAGATKISQTHFADRDEHVLANVSARRYFCTQCHVPQVDAQPLVENTFKPVTAITGKQ